MERLERRMQILGAVIAVIGVIAVAGGAYGWTQIQAGATALAGFSAAQNVTLTYNDQGQLVDRGSTDNAVPIMALLKDSWKWPVSQGDLNPKDPLVNTGTEYMYQMATIAHHTLDGTQSVTLPAEVGWDGQKVVEVAALAASDPPVTTYTPESLAQLTADEYVKDLTQPAIFEPGTYTVPVAERYYTAFNRSHPLDGPARDLAWSGLVHGLFAELGVGATTAAALQMGQALAEIAVAFGVAFLITGLGLVWVGAAQRKAAYTA